MAYDAIRDALHSAVTFVQGTEKNRALYNLTLDHLLYEQIQMIEGGDPDFALSIQGQMVSRRVPKLQRLDELKKTVDRIVTTEEKVEGT